jgi:ADP-ribose pyrophosphatase YjhB (NUDIX family)
VLQREHRTSKTWFLAGSNLLNEEHVDAAIRELFEESGLSLTVEDLTRLSGDHARVSLPSRQYELVHVFSAYVHVMYAFANLRTRTKVIVHAVIAKSIAHLSGTYVVLAIVDIDGLSLTPSKTWLVREAQRKYKLLHFGYVPQ